MIGAMGRKVVVPVLLNSYNLNYEQLMSKLFMSGNNSSAYTKLIDVNSFTKIWRMDEANIPLAGHFPTDFRLVVMVLDSVEDERTYSSLSSRLEFTAS